jgi:hypothetical protein
MTKKCFPYGLKNNTFAIKETMHILCDMLKVCLGIEAEPEVIMIH